MPKIKLPSISPFYFVGCISIVVMAAVILLALNMSSPQQLVNNDPVKDGSIEVVNIDTNANYVLAALKPDDTIALEDDAGEQIVIALEHYDWKDISWSPDGELLAVLGSPDGNNFDLYIYKPSTNRWRQATNYAEADIGVGTYKWLDEDKLLYTQGLEDLLWVHRYNYENDEVFKLFPSAGDIFAVADGRVIVAHNQGQTLSVDYAYTIYDLEGTDLYEFTASDIGSGMRLLDLKTDSAGRYLLNTRSGTETSYYLWQESEQIFEKVLDEDAIIAASASDPVINGSIKVLCHRSTQLYYAYVLSGNTINLISVNPVTNTYTGVGEYSYNRNIDVKDEASFCVGEEAYLNIQEFGNTISSLSWLKLEDDLAVADDLTGYLRLAIK